MRLFKSVCWLFSSRSSVYAHTVAAALIAILFVIICTAFVPVWYRDRCEDRVREIRVTLEILRRAIALHHKQSGSYPASLTEFRTSLSQGSRENWERMYVDLTSRRQSRVPEYRQLNDKGGYYYDPNSGEIRLNLTKPVKDYFCWYTGKYAEQIPSDW